MAALELYDFTHAVYGYLMAARKVVPDSGLAQRCQDILDWIEEGRNRITEAEGAALDHRLEIAEDDLNDRED